MQPGPPPYPPQQPGPFGGQPPYQGQPYPGPPPMGQPGYPPQFYPGPPAPRKSKTGLIVLIVVAVVVVLGGGGTAAVLLLNKPTPVAGRYTGKPPACATLDIPSYRFTDGHPTSLDGNLYTESCNAIINDQLADGSVSVDMWRYLGSDGVASAQAATTGRGESLPGTGFENPPSASFQSSATSSDCTFEYTRSNEYVLLDFSSLAGAHDQASCAQVGLPIVRKLYALIG